jgi:transportin-3
MFGGQEHELNMRTAELIEGNAEKALQLLVQYATSSRTSCIHPSMLMY